ncbi:MAG TPA: hypothetical protein VK885_13645 [Desulfotignum sp.]|jgi:hypothetical protein|nr:hypothetical protein [Desulfotignum sp.]
MSLTFPLIIIDDYFEQKNVNADTSQAVRLDHRICGTRDDLADAAHTLVRLLRPPAFLLQPVPSPA